jgi:hypothetical protein
MRENARGGELRRAHGYDRQPASSNLRGGVKAKAFDRETKQDEALVLEFQPEETQWPGPPL